MAGGAAQGKAASSLSLLFTKQLQVLTGRSNTTPGLAYKTEQQRAQKRQSPTLPTKKHKKAGLEGS